MRLLPVFLLLVAGTAMAQENSPELPRLQDLDARNPFNAYRPYAHTTAYPNANFHYYWINMYHLDPHDLPVHQQYVLVDSAGIERYAIPRQGEVTSRFGPRALFSTKFHYGTDVDLNTGDTVCAAMGGVVRLARNDPGGYGNFVLVAHENGLETLYAHLSEFLVQPGEPVWPGKPLGKGGNTGRSTGAHLHFEFRYFGEQFNAEHVLDFAHDTVKAARIAVQPGWFKHLHDPRYSAAHYELAPLSDRVPTPPTGTAHLGHGVGCTCGEEH